MPAIRRASGVTLPSPAPRCNGSTISARKSWSRSKTRLRCRCRAPRGQPVALRAMASCCAAGRPQADPRAGAASPVTDGPSASMYSIDTTWNVPSGPPSLGSTAATRPRRLRTVASMPTRGGGACGCGAVVIEGRPASNTSSTLALPRHRGQVHGGSSGPASGSSLTACDEDTCGIPRIWGWPRRILYDARARGVNGETGECGELPRSLPLLLEDPARSLSSRRENRS